MRLRILACILAAALTWCLGEPSAWTAGMVTLSFDDGLSSVYTDAFPVLKRYGQRATVGIVSNRVTSRDDNYMDVSRVLELQKNGWEVASHGLTHKRPTEIPQYLSDEPITGWESQGRTPNVYKARYGYELVAGILEEGRSLKAVNSVEEVGAVVGSYYFDPIIGEVHLHTFSPENPKELDIRSISYQRELRDSKKKLGELGFMVASFVAPYNHWTPAMREVSKYYYEQVAHGGGRVNFRDNFDRHWLYRFNMQTLGPADEVIKLLRKSVQEKDGWVILCFHGIEDNTGWQPWSVDKLEVLASWLREQEIRVVTLAEGAALFSGGAD
jgi:peptidoglycan/xylan/chitin deacetylase (PgdA/CDA1 family)